MCEILGLPITFYCYNIILFLLSQDILIESNDVELISSAPVVLVEDIMVVNESNDGTKILGPLCSSQICPLMEENDYHKLKLGASNEETEKWQDINYFREKRSTQVSLVSPYL